MNKLNRVKKVVEWIIYSQQLETQKDLAKLMGYSESAFSQILNGKVPLADKFIKNLSILDTRINVEWILSQSGQMLLPSKVERMDVICFKKPIDRRNAMLPEVDFELNPNNASLSIQDDKIKRHWLLPDSSDCDVVIQMTGNSMTPTYPPGCWVSLKKIGFSPNFVDNIPYGNVFAVAIEDQMTGQFNYHIKILRKHHDDTLRQRYIVAHSLNSIDYDDFSIDVHEIKGLWVVKQYIVSNLL